MWSAKKMPLNFSGFQEPIGEANDKDPSKDLTISLGVLVISLGADAKELDKDAIKVATKFWDTLQFPAVITEALAAVPKHQHDSKVGMKGQISWPFHFPDIYVHYLHGA